MRILFQFPKWRFKSLIISYDDGRDFDRRLVKIFNDCGVKGTFHLCPTLFDKKNYLTSKEIGKLFEGHEISCHTLAHPSLANYPNIDGMREVWDCRRQLEELCGYPVQSMSYPNGSVDDTVVAVLKAAGITSCRTTIATEKFVLPEDFLRWHPTCKHHQAPALLDAFLNHGYHIMRCFFVWGHSYEFDMDNNWDLIEDFCRKIGGHEDIWYAGMTEMVRYVTAVRSAVSTADGRIWYNPSAETLYCVVDGKNHSIAPGGMLQL